MRGWNRPQPSHPLLLNLPPLLRPVYPGWSLYQLLPRLLHHWPRCLRNGLRTRLRVPLPYLLPHQPPAVHELRSRLLLRQQLGLEVPAPTGLQQREGMLSLSLWQLPDQLVKLHPLRIGLHDLHAYQHILLHQLHGSNVRQRRSLPPLHVRMPLMPQRRPLCEMPIRIQPFPIAGSILDERECSSQAVCGLHISLHGMHSRGRFLPVLQQRVRVGRGQMPQ